MIEYKSFRAERLSQSIYHPYLLKEYRNRWFLISRKKRGTTLYIMALERIIEFQELSKKPFAEYDEVDFEHYYLPVKQVHDGY